MTGPSARRSSRLGERIGGCYNRQTDGSPKQRHADGVASSTARLPPQEGELMDREGRRKFEEYRRSEAGPVENTLIDELLDGEMDRGEFVKRGTMFGLSASIL